MLVANIVCTLWYKYCTADVIGAESCHYHGMKYHLILLFLGLATSAFGRRGNRPSQQETTAAPESVVTTAGDTTEEDDEYVSLVKSYIDAGTCGQISTGSLCGDEATSYFTEFEYLGKRVIITNSIPDHEAESDAVNPNPNTRWRLVTGEVGLISITVVSPDVRDGSTCQSPSTQARAPQ